MAALMALVATLAAQAAQSTAPPPSTATGTDTENARRLGQSTYVDLEAGAGYSTNPESIVLVG